MFRSSAVGVMRRASMLVLQFLTRAHTREELCLAKAKYKGPAAIHRIYRKRKAGITELQRQKPSFWQKLSADGSQLTVTVELPLVSKASDIDLVLEERQIKVEHALYALDLVFHDFLLDHISDDCDAVYDACDRRMRVRVPIRKLCKTD